LLCEQLLVSAAHQVQLGVVKSRITSGMDLAVYVADVPEPE
jgi:hypothetical protein